MRKKVTAVGNSLAFVIDKPIAELLHIDKDTELEVSTDGKMLFVMPLIKPREEILKVVRTVRKKYRKTLDRLATKGASRR